MTTPLARARWTRWSIRLDEASDGRPLCLSLANTRTWRNSAAPKEVLGHYDALVQWAAAREIVDKTQAAQLTKLAQAHPRASSAELQRTIALREAIASVFAAIAHTRRPNADDLAIVTASFNEAAAQLELDVVEGRLVPRVRVDNAMPVPRWQAALSAIGLYTSGDASRIKQCADDRGCGWLFVDTTRNGSRRFCFSNECGNRARQVRFRARQDPAHASGHEH
jgi:predicted RNA-binding Zn ribbon-like protein